MKGYRISKYDPRFRLDGIYTRDEWTAYDDIGACFGGVTLTESAYLDVERRYLDCVGCICEQCGAFPLAIRNKEDSGHPVKWREGQSISDDVTLKAVLRDCLREGLWCRLIGEKAIVDTGYDYYVHLWCDLLPEVVTWITSEYGLFVEEWTHDPFDV